MMAFGQTAITEELYAARERAGGRISTTSATSRILDAASRCPHVTFEKDGVGEELECDFIAGCDGFHGISREAIPADVRRTFERAYPFGSLGWMLKTRRRLSTSSTPSMIADLPSPLDATQALSRYYIQCDVDAKLEDWPDDRFWQELKARFLGI